jgi:hypothetical protein
MPAPSVTCILVAAVLLALFNPVLGAVVALIAAALEFFLPNLAA